MAIASLPAAANASELAAALNDSMSSHSNSATYLNDGSPKGDPKTFPWRKAAHSTGAVYSARCWA
jgi:hypothetical protein